MTNRQRPELRDNLLYALGLAVDPIRRAIEAGITSPHEIALIRARFQVDCRYFEAAARDYCTIDALFLQNEYEWIMSEFRQLVGCLGPLEYPETRCNAAHGLEQKLSQVRARIARVPMQPPSEILPATPYQTFLRLRSLILGSIERVELFDPYLDAPVYHRYLAHLAPEVRLVVVTTRANLGVGKTDKRVLARRDRIVACSELLAAERPTTYHLLAAAPFHDRYIRVDDTVLHLGGSLKDASKNQPYTVSPLTEAPADGMLDAIVASADEWYGPTSSSHRRN